MRLAKAHNSLRGLIALINEMYYEKGLLQLRADNPQAALDLFKSIMMLFNKFPGLKAYC